MFPGRAEFGGRGGRGGRRGGGGAGRGAGGEAGGGPGGGGGRGRGLKPCSFAQTQAYCFKKASPQGCTFQHPPDCRFSRQCTNSECKFLHPIEKCKFWDKCTNNLCQRRHANKNVEKIRQQPIFRQDRGADVFKQFVDLCKVPMFVAELPAALEAEMKQHAVPSRQKHIAKLLLLSQQLMEAEKNVRRHAQSAPAVQQMKQREMQTCVDSVDHARMELQVFDDTIHQALQVDVSDASQLADARRQIRRESLFLRLALPVYGMRSRLKETLDNNQFVVIQRDSDYNTSAQLAVFVADWIVQSKVVWIAPSAQEADWLARRTLQGWVGGDRADAVISAHRVVSSTEFSDGSEAEVSEETRIHFTTAITMLQALRKNRDALSGVEVILVDAASAARSLECDVLMDFIRTEIRHGHIDCRLVILASIFESPIPYMSLLGTKTVLRIESSEGNKSQPPKEVFVPVDKAKRIDVVTAAAELTAKIHRDAPLGKGCDIVCFLPFSMDIPRAVKIFKARLNSLPVAAAGAAAANRGEPIVVSLFEFPDVQADRFIFRPAPQGSRKVIFATSKSDYLSIDGVAYVVDCGKNKVLCVDSAESSLATFEIRSITRGAAATRCSMAGRGSSQGTCYRLYSKEDLAAFSDQPPSQVEFSPLHSALLWRIALGLPLREYQWIHSPLSASPITSALDALIAMGCVQPEQDEGEYRQLTVQGGLLLDLPLDVFLARMVVRGVQMDRTEVASVLAAVLSHSHSFFLRDVDFGGSSVLKQKFDHESGDIMSFFTAFSSFLPVLTATDEASFMHALCIEPSRDEVLAGGGAEEEGDGDANLDAILDSVKPAGAGDGRADGLVVEDVVEDVHVEDVEFEDEADRVAAEDTQVAEQFLLEAQGDDTDETETIAEVESAVKLAWPQASVWCQRNSINFKTAIKAFRLRESILRAVRSESFQSFRDSNPVAAPATLPVLVGRLAASAFFINTASLVVDSEYELITGSVKPVLVTIHNSVKSASGSPPMLVFQSLNTVGHRFIVNHVSVEESWVREESHLISAQIDLRRASPCVRVIIPNVAEDEVRKLLGHNWHLKTFRENEWNCCIRFDLDKACVELWCSSNRSDEVQNLFQESLAKIRRDQLTEFVEQAWLGGSRIVLGPGFVVERILFQGEFITIKLHDLPMSITEPKLADLVAPFGEVRAVNILFGSQWSNAATATFADPRAAAAAVLGLNGSSIDGKVIRVIGKIEDSVKEDPQEASCFTKLLLSWATAPSTGKALVTFETHHDAVNAARRIQYGAFGFATSKLMPKPGAEGGGIDQSTVVSLHKLSADIDEYEIQARLSAFSPKRVFVQRDLSASVLKNCTKEDAQVALDADLASMLSRLPPNRQPTEVNSVFNQDFGRAQVFLTYNSVGAGTDALAAWNSIYPPLTRCRSNINATLVIQSWVLLLTSVWNFRSEEIAVIIASAKLQSVKVAVSDKANSPFKQARITGSRAQAVSKVANDLMALMQTATFVPPSAMLKSVFSTAKGRAKFEVLTARHRCLLLWENRLSVIRIVCSEADVEAIQQDLTELCERLMSTVQEEDIAIQPRKRKELIAALKNYKNEDIFYAFCLRSKMQVKGTAEAIIALKAWLVEHDYLGEAIDAVAAAAAAVQAEADGMCLMCMCELDKPFFYKTCKHGGCTGCLEYQFLENPSAPVCCAICSALMAVSDVKKLASEAKVTAIMELSVDNFIRDSHGRYRYCPVPGCNNVLDRERCRRPVDEREERILGGHTISCNKCQASYCLVCCDRDHKPVNAHPQVTCRDAELGDAEMVIIHRKRIVEDLLTLKCPKCHKAVLDWNGCCAVTCECGCNFCGFCFHTNADNSDTHPHVQSCSKNPEEGNYFATEQVLATVHRGIRITSILRYLELIPDKALRSAIVGVCAIDLEYLRISRDDLLAAL